MGNLDRVNGVAEASINFDMADVRPFLERVASLGVIESGFGDPQIDKVVAWVQQMEVDAEEEMTFTIRYKGAEVPLIVHVFMDDEEAPDVYFFTAPELANAIQAEMRRYSDELGR